ncbi:MAG: 2-methylisoborneol synthase [Solirubrobacteraceae bacterium]|jgi:2-methylisoborneol synthase|nr:2-methylisoborneol synthase [Solirubrobacteraceae bacterium]
MGAVTSHTLAQLLAGPSGLGTHSTRLSCSDVTAVVDAAPPGSRGLAGLVDALLSNPERPDPSELPAPSSDVLVREETMPAPTEATRLLGGPTGLGTSAARLAADVTGATAVGPLPSALIGLGTSAPPDDDDGAAAESSMPDLFCPGAVRDNPALGEEVNDRLVNWAEEVGIYPDNLDRLRTSNFGRLIMLAHPATDDPDRLLAAAKCVVAEWAADDYYVDEVSLGADPRVVGSRLAKLHAVVDPAQLPLQYAPQLEEFMRGEPIATAFRTAMEHLARYASATQMGRFQHQMGILFGAWNQEADWHRNGSTPPVWEYLVQRHLNSYLPPMILMDPVAGYELPPNEFYDPRVRWTFTMAGLANVLLNDLYSAGFESDTDFNLPRVIVAEDGCSWQEAIKRTVEIHNELMHRFVAEAAALSMTGSPLLLRFFVDTWAWMGGSREWHATTGRYHAGDGN